MRVTKIIEKCPIILMKMGSGSCSAKCIWVTLIFMDLSFAQPKKKHLQLRKIKSLISRILNSVEEQVTFASNGISKERHQGR